MALEFTPDDAKALISDPTSSLCGNFVNTLLKVPVKFYQLVKHLFDADGNAKAMFEPGDKVESFTPLAENEHRKLCNGQELSKTTYAALYAAIGDVYATMDGQSAPASGNFRVPKVGARFALAVGTLPSASAVAIGSTGGAETVTLALTNIPEHGHDLNIAGSDGSNSTIYDGLQTADESVGGAVAPSYKTNGGNPGTNPYVDPVGGDGSGNAVAHTNMPPYYGLYVYIITGN